MEPSLPFFVLTFAIAGLGWLATLFMRRSSVASTTAILLASAVLLGLGTAKFLAQFFLLFWEFPATGESDIAARGTWLLSLYLPFIVVVSVLATTSAVTLLTPRMRRSVSTFIAAVLGGSIGALLVLTGLEPTVYALRWLGWPARWYYLTSLVVAGLIIAGGVWVVRRAQGGPFPSVSTA